MAKKIDIEKWFSDPEFQGDRDLINAAIDKRIEERVKKAKESEEGELTFLQRLFDGAPKKGE